MEADGVSLNAADYTDHASYYKTFANYLAGVTDCGVYGVSCFSLELRNNYNNINIKYFASYNWCYKLLRK